MLELANDRLYPDIPANMFVTCLYAVLNPKTGRLRYANAGHNLPYLATAGGVAELRATGMPLGAMPGMSYEENEAHLAPGDSVLLHSDGLVEAHDPSGEMFGFARLQKVVENSSGGKRLIEECLAELGEFVGRDWEQEDDITLVALERIPSRSATVSGIARKQWRAVTGGNRGDIRTSVRVPRRRADPQGEPGRARLGHPALLRGRRQHPSGTCGW